MPRTRLILLPPLPSPQPALIIRRRPVPDVPDPARAAGVGLDAPLTTQARTSVLRHTFAVRTLPPPLLRWYRRGQHPCEISVAVTYYGNKDTTSASRACTYGPRRRRPELLLLASALRLERHPEGPPAHDV